jgi:shikimate kinase
MSIKLDKTVVLVGLMGAGKTTVGSRLAKNLNVEFADSDQEISEAAGCSVSDIFAIHGEEIFRDLELRVMTRLLNNPPHVLATGGGAFINPKIRKLIKENAISIWLKADVNTLVERVSRKNTRPLLEAGDKHQILEKLMEERYPIYAGADEVVESGKGSHEKIVQTIIQGLSK